MQTLETFAGRYALQQQLGTGALGEVWLAKDSQSGGDVALKILGPGDTGEAATLAALDHPGIVRVLDYGKAGPRPYLAMEYVEGRTLRDVLAGEGRLPEATAVDYGMQAAAALEHAHARGVVHRDLKPENLLITPGGQVKVADFGIARQMLATLSPEEARELVGTLGYLAPEVVEGRPAGMRSDIYSLAAIVYEMVAGRLPFAGTGAA
ncbi:MAG: serine/threonine-protein kinase, partial [Acidimicrobiales bacterium]